MNNFGQDVAYIAAVVSDPQYLAQLMEKHLRLPREALRYGNEHVESLQVGRTRLVLFGPTSAAVGGEAKTGIHHIGVAVENPLETAQHFGLTGDKPKLEASLDGGSRVRIPPDATKGLLTYFCDPLAAFTVSNDVVERVDHLGVVTTSNDESRSFFCDRLGLEVESFQTDIEGEIPLESFTSNKYGVVYHTRAPRLKAGIKGLFVTLGDFDLEFLESFDPGESGEFRNLGPGNTRQDHNAVARFLQGRGPGLHHIAFKVKDINAVLAELEGAGVKVLDKKGRPGGRRSQIGFVHPSGMSGILVHFVQRQEI